MPRLSFIEEIESIFFFPVCSTPLIDNGYSIQWQDPYINLVKISEICNRHEYRFSLKQNTKGYEIMFKRSVQLPPTDATIPPLRTTLHDIQVGQEQTEAKNYMMRLASQTNLSTSNMTSTDIENRACIFTFQPTFIDEKNMHMLLSDPRVIAATVHATDGIHITLTVSNTILYSTFTRNKKVRQYMNPKSFKWPRKKLIRRRHALLYKKMKKNPETS